MTIVIIIRGVWRSTEYFDWTISDRWTADAGLADVAGEIERNLVPKSG